MPAVALMSRPSPSTHSLPSIRTSSPTSTSPSVITLPRLHIPNDSTPSAFHSFGHPLKPVYATPSPSSAESKFGLAHLLEAAEQCRPLPTSYVQPMDFTPSPNARLHSIDYLINRPSEDERPAKRARPNLQLDVNTPYHYEPSHQTVPYNMTTPVYQTPSSSYMHITPVGTHDEILRHSENPVDSKNVWETVLVTGNFPDDICLSENPSCTKPSELPGNPVKQGRWTNDEKEFAENLIQQVRNGEVALPPNTSLRKFIADSLQCKTMRVSKKFRSLRVCHSPDGSSGDERKFNPLSLQSIMNEDADADSFDDEMEQHSPKTASKTLKRSDYSQHGAVRSGRWSIEEENYAKAMIEAFKNGYLPLHGNVSLRKFLSEVLVCHPMRISKKFVGYVRKYHWYRIAAGKCDPEAKRRALEQLCHLEREFWASLQQNQEWTAIQQENRR